MSMTEWEQKQYDTRHETMVLVGHAMREAATKLLDALKAKGAVVDNINDRTREEHAPHYSIREVNGEYLAVEFKAEESKRGGDRFKTPNGRVYIAIGSYGFQKRYNQRKSGFPIDEIADHILGEVKQKQRAAVMKRENDARDERLNAVVAELKAANPVFLGQQILIERSYGRIKVSVSFADPDAARAFMAIAQEAKPE